MEGTANAFHVDFNDVLVCATPSLPATIIDKLEPWGLRYGDKVYRVTVNARTGEIAHERPWSAFKIAMLCFVIVAIIVAIIYLVR